MKKLYHKYQGFYLIIASVFFGNALFLFIQDDYTERFSIKENYLIIDKRCSAAPSITSFVEIKKGRKTYTVDLPEKECVNYSVGEKIPLYYNKRYDYFIYPDRNVINLSRLVFSGIAFFLLLLPWKLITTLLKPNGSGD
ncbi:MAG: hypothetical protein B7Y83_11915 [Flavobacteriales bacterium 32-34-25]|nr:MAG: hypothetical protein B7Y83_11915 [Flavobacteriales bacterium 32-34-25]